MQRPESTEYHPNYQKYFDLVKPGEFPETLQRNTAEVVQVFESMPADKHNYRYAEGKWTIKEVLQHIIDTERVFSNRGLAAARGDETPAYRMDEELYANNVDVKHRMLTDVIDEFKAVRASTEFLFLNIGEEQSKWSCNVVSHPMTARAIGYFIIGHAEHHCEIVRQRYLETPLSQLSEAGIQAAQQ